MARPVDADVLQARLHAERVQQPVVVVGRAVALVDGDVELVGALDQIERLDDEARPRRRRERVALELLDVGVRAVAADAFGVEDADAEDEVVDRRPARAGLSRTVSGSPV